MNDNDQEQFRVVHDQIGKVHGKMKENIELAVQRYVFHIYCRIIPHL
jgi:translation elongation factor P/translation initiation factor 5A